jgi:hypothetical protein
VCREDCRERERRRVGATVIIIIVVGPIINEERIERIQYLSQRRVDRKSDR